MSQSDIDRFAEDLKADAGLRAELASSATGIASVVKFADEKGYKIEAEDVAAYIQAQTASELSDSQIDAIVGGKGGHHGINLRGKNYEGWCSKGKPAPQGGTLVLMQAFGSYGFVDPLANDFVRFIKKLDAYKLVYKYSV